MDISIVGGGYVGLVTAVGLAGIGHTVVCIDIDREKVDLINRAEAPFYEDGLSQALHTCVKERRGLRASLDYEEITESELTFICVNTSSNSGENADFSHIQQSAKRIGESLSRKEGYHTVVTKSSVVPGTTEEVIIPLLERHSGKAVGRDIGVSVNPEFLQEGRALQSFLNTDRIIIGEYDQRSGNLTQEAYNGSRAPVLRTRIRTAEMIKFASNAFLATRISFINEIGNLCKKLGIDVYDVADGMGHDPRIGRAFLNAGIGFGGSCLPKDLEALLRKSREMSEKPSVLSAVYETNSSQPQRIVDVARSRLGELRDKDVAILGLAFKPDTDDTRNAPSVEIIRLLLQQGAQVKAYDPRATSKVRDTFCDRISYGDSIRDTIAECDCVLILTEWDEFRDENLYSGKVVIDGRRALNPEKARLVCQSYEGVCW